LRVDKNLRESFRRQCRNGDDVGEGIGLLEKGVGMHPA
jgi:hypothetical protein